MALLTQTETKQSTLLPTLFAWRTRFGFGWLEALVLALYCVVLAVVIPFHELWGDEAQAWEIASHNSTWQILGNRLHYEGAPPLWHLLLHAFYSAGGHYTGMGWFGASFAVAGIAVMLRWAPFPLIIRILLPFTFFLQYQYAAISRGYCLFPLLTFLLCELFRRKERFVWFALVAGLLANLSLQGVILAFALLTFYLYDFYRRQHYVPLAEPRVVFSLFAFDLLRTRTLVLAPHLRRQLRQGALVFGSLLFLSFLVAWPAPDLTFAVAPGGGGLTHDLAEATIGELPRTAPDPLWDPYLFPETQPTEPHLLTAPAAWAAWHINHRAMVDKEGHWGPQSFESQAIEFIVGAASQATWPIATSNLLACLFLGTLLFWLYTRHALRWILPWAVLIFVGQILWVADHHAGMLFVALLAGIWLAAPAASTEPTFLQSTDLAKLRQRQRASYAHPVFLGALAVILALQVRWSYATIRNEIYGSYDPGPETAAYLQSHHFGSIAAFHFFETSLQPWFPRSPFFNVPDPWWRWSWHANPDDHHRPVIASHPDLVVYTTEFPGYGQMRNQWAPVSHLPTAEEERDLPRDIMVRSLRAHGYRETHRFCGARFSRLSSSYRVCDILFEPDPSFHYDGSVTAPLNDPIEQN